jgi:hypothetical protein
VLVLIHSESAVIVPSMAVVYRAVIINADCANPYNCGTCHP